MDQYGRHNYISKQAGNTDMHTTQYVVDMVSFVSANAPPLNPKPKHTNITPFDAISIPSQHL
jgi:hypothetical protein